LKVTFAVSSLSNSRTSENRPTACINCEWQSVCSLFLSTILGLLKVTDKHVQCAIIVASGNQYDIECIHNTSYNDGTSVKTKRLHAINRPTWVPLCIHKTMVIKCYLI